METTTHIKPRLAFAGVGWIGRHRMQAAVQTGLAEVAGVTDPSEECVNEAVKLVNAQRTYTSFEETVADPDVDAVVIATPSALHMEQAVYAFENNKAVFCQKPLGRNAQEVQNVIEAARAANKLLGADFSYRHTAAFKSILRLIASQELGDIFAVELKFHNAYGPGKPWFYDIKQAGGGCVLDLGVHMIDLALFALGFPKVTNVSSRLYAKGNILKSRVAVEDYADAMFVAGENVNIHLSCSWNLQAGKEAEIEASFYGTKGGAALKNINGSFYDFAAYRYRGTETEKLAEPPDDWGGRAISLWLEQLSINDSFQSDANDYLASAQVIDRIYGIE